MSGGSLTGKTCIVTGATSGIGEETALAIARLGARVGILARSPDRAEASRERIIAESGQSDVEVVICDLASLESIREASAEILRRFDRLDILVNNAGLIGLQRTTTQDGFETTIGVNHLGPFLLTNLLLDRIVQSAPARIVNVSSEGHRFARRGLNLADLQNEIAYGAFRVYCESKLANVLFTSELARKLEGTGVNVNAVHPGAVATRLGQNNGTFAKLATTLLKPFFRTPAQGAATSIHVATSSEGGDVTGRYFMNSKQRTPSANARDTELARALWAKSAELVGVADSSDTSERPS
jgi:NAD(P)-dependent dehydrogenase (short-subunit alcohol dehydrogenase family)